MDTKCRPFIEFRRAHHQLPALRVIRIYFRRVPCVANVKAANRFSFEGLIKKYSLTKSFYASSSIQINLESKAAEFPVDIGNIRLFYRSLYRFQPDCVQLPEL